MYSVCGCYAEASILHLSAEQPMLVKAPPAPTLLTYLENAVKFH